MEQKQSTFQNTGGKKMGKALIIGCGGVASVAIHKCCQNSEAFEEICIASRTKSKCDALKEKLEGTTKTKIQTAQVDANNVDELIALIEKFNPDVVLNLALPYQDLTIMDACLATKTHYIDTANSEPEDTAKFITTPLLYIILGTYFVVFFIYNRLLLRKMKKEEWLPIVDEKGEVSGQAPRSICHSGSKLLHPVVHLHITNDRHELFLQKRSMKKDLLPGMWDTAVGGHIGVNEKVEDALKREASEELGITDFEARFLGNYVWESPHERELVFSFLCTRYNRIHIDNDEVDEGRFWTLQELAEGMEKNKLTPNLVHEYRLLLKPLFNRS